MFTTIERAPGVSSSCQLFDNTVRRFSIGILCDEHRSRPVSCHCDCWQVAWSTRGGEDDSQMGATTTGTSTGAYSVLRHQFGACTRLLRHHSGVQAPYFFHLSTLGGSFFHRFVSALNGLRPCLPMIVYLLFKCKFQTAPQVSAMFWDFGAYFNSINDDPLSFHIRFWAATSFHRERLFLIQCRPPRFFFFEHDHVS